MNIFLQFKSWAWSQPHRAPGEQQQPRRGISLSCVHARWLLCCTAVHPTWLQKPSQPWDCPCARESGSGWRAEWAWFWWDNLGLGGERRVLGRTQMQDTGRRCGASENMRVGRSWFNPSWQSSPTQPVTYSPLHREENQNGKSETTQWLR